MKKSENFVKHSQGVSQFVHNRVLCSVASFLFIMSGILSAQAGQSYSEVTAEHPGWVQIPGELIRPDCVHEIPNGASVEIRGDQATGDVTLNGTVIAHYDACPESAIVTRHLAQTEGRGQPPTINGWVEASQWYVSLSGSDNIDLMDGYWYVPSNPRTNNGYFYLFNGIEPSDGSWILQPVLQYGAGYAGGGNYWAIASWLVGPPPNYYVFVSPLETVHPGDLLFGYTEQTGVSGSNLDWKVQAYDDNTGAYSWITAHTSGLHWTRAYSGVLEAYGINSCSDLPSNGYAEFQESSVYHGFPSYNYISPQGWYGAIYGSGGLSCGFSVSAGNTTVLYF